MGDTQTRRTRAERKSAVIGVSLTVAAHAAALVLVSFSGLKYIYPPPEETSMLIDFDEAELVQMEEKTGVEPQAEDVNMHEAVNLVQKSESPVAATAENLTPETVQDNFGDVAVPSPEPEQPKLDPRASFPGKAKKDTSLTAPHAAAESSENFKAGQARGNTSSGRADGKPNAHVPGRNTVGNLPRPVYDIQESGTVVVTIWVDNYGNVVKAVPGGDGTTVTDKTLWAAARKAAMETHFNMNADAPAMQEGTITYIFNLK